MNRRLVSAWAFVLLFAMACVPAFAQETICARVKIEIKQEMTLERQAFDAEMRITNTLPSTSLDYVKVDVWVTDEYGETVSITTDPNNLSASFFIRQTRTENISDTNGTGQVAAATTAVANWMLIPAPGAAGNTPLGKRYLVGATLRYQFGTETHVLELTPDSITVRPMPELVLDYFLTRDVEADNPFTPEIEPPEPYTLGVRVKNNGIGVARKLKIESAQPRIVENEQGLLVNFVILGSYVQDMPVSNSLLIDFGDIPGGGGAKMGRWVMESNLSGTFVDFTATFTHADELGGALTSLLQETNAYLLVRDVRVDLPGRDFVRDFLALDGTRYRIFESEGQDSDVIDRSDEATLSTTAGGYRLEMPGSSGFVYVRKPDPHQGQMALGAVVRADAKQIAPENVWLSRTRNPVTQGWEFWFNIFDVNSPGAYNVAFVPRAEIPVPPVLQFIPDRVVRETEHISFIVEGSSPMGRPVTLSASPLPLGASFDDQGGGLGVFDWTPGVGQAGDYTITYRVSDGALTGSRSARIRVESETPPAGPAIPQVVSPLSGAEVASLRPFLRVLTGEHSQDPTVQVEFQLYADVGMTVLLEEAIVAKSPMAGEPTQWRPEADLNDNNRYYWRARAVAAEVASEWVNANFFANLFNDPPGSFNLTSPEAGANVGSLTPVLSATNAVDPDGDVVTYGFEVYDSSTLTEVVDSVSDLPEGENGTTQWQVTVPLTDRATYYWRGIATDEHGARTITPARNFRVFVDNHTPTVPTIAAPPPGSRVIGEDQVWLRINNSTDEDGDPLTYLFEIDVVNTFDSSERQASGDIAAGSGGTTSWLATNLTQNQHYYWRARASDGFSNSDWAVSDFILDSQNEPPTVPTIANPGDRAWVSTRTPTFTVHQSTDPDGDEILYVFEIYTDIELNNRVTSGTSSTVSWQPTTMLADQTTHYWRVRAQDVRGAASDWSPVMTLFVSTRNYVPPTIAVTSPSTITNAASGSVTITWTGTNLNIEPRIALYYDQTGSGYAGTKIVEGLSQNAGTQTGSYEWNMAGLPAGAYHIYGVIYDDRGSSQAYAPGTLVVPGSPQLGGIGYNPSNPNFQVIEGQTTGFRIMLTRAPTSTVVVPVTSSDTTEATVSPQQITFTPSNWNRPQLVTVRTIDDGIIDGDQPVEISVGQAVSNDPHYIGVSANSVHGVVRDIGVDAGSELFVSGYVLVSKLNLVRTWRYTYRVVLRNEGPRVNGVTASIVSSPPGYRAIGTLEFGAIGQDESVTSSGTISVDTEDDLGEQGPHLIWRLQAR
ncbi:hypothetical protein LDO26_01235 [Luteimonas sp. BDR2-5]|uniref:hypothetical protein n=1 Tax=Proluteimonas luteida TaxID=2878685 RepID=UPI001E6494CF|nr:hypothetical protein [Luteimonas sp. BDR2-5]MCD9026840.1 hypothetical protein [Luteimonas sp. BDR2-5]